MWPALASAPLDGTELRLGFSSTTESRSGAPGKPRKLACARVQSIVAIGEPSSGAMVSGPPSSPIIRVGSQTCATAARLCARIASPDFRSATAGSGQAISIRNG